MVVRRAAGEGGAQNREGGMRKKKEGEGVDKDGEDYSCDEDGEVVERTGTRDK